MKETGFKEKLKAEEFINKATGEPIKVYGKII